MSTSPESTIRRYLDEHGGEADATVRHLLTTFGIQEDDLRGRDEIVKALANAGVRVDRELVLLTLDEEVRLSVEDRGAVNTTSPAPAAGVTGEPTVSGEGEARSRPSEHQPAESREDRREGSLLPEHQELSRPAPARLEEAAGPAKLSNAALAHVGETAGRAGAMVTEHVRSILEAAERNAQEIRREARREADEIRREALRDATEILERVNAIEAPIGDLRHRLEIVVRGATERSTPELSGGAAEADDPGGRLLGHGAGAEPPTGEATSEGARSSEEAQASGKPAEGSQLPVEEASTREGEGPGPATRMGEISQNGEPAAVHGEREAEQSGERPPPAETSEDQPGTSASTAPWRRPIDRPDEQQPPAQPGPATPRPVPESAPFLPSSPERKGGLLSRLRGGRR